MYVGDDGPYVCMFQKRFSEIYNKQLKYQKFLNLGTIKILSHGW